MGDRNWAIWGGWLWLLSAFLDRADGELARVTGKTSPGGQVFDIFYDVTVTSLFFLGAGFSLRDEIFLDVELGQWPIWLGADGVFAAEIFAEFIDRAEADTGEKAYPAYGVSTSTISSISSRRSFGSIGTYISFSAQPSVHRHSRFSPGTSGGRWIVKRQFIQVLRTNQTLIVDYASMIFCVTGPGQSAEYTLPLTLRTGQTQKLVDEIKHSSAL